MVLNHIQQNRIWGVDQPQNIWNQNDFVEIKIFPIDNCKKFLTENCNLEFLKQVQSNTYLGNWKYLNKGLLKFSNLKNKTKVVNIET